jgi:hypothetical protein
VSFPDVNVDLRRSGIEQQVRAALERVIPSEVGRVEALVKKTPGAKRVRLYDRGGMLFDYTVEG